MSHQATLAATLVDEWVRAGVTDAVVCPGSRSAPLALALDARPELTVHVRLDERSAAFFGLGLALGSGRPVVVCTTSGTAAAELHPAVIEADLSRVPLIVCTADRPPELHHVGAPQTIDQTRLFGPAVRWFCQPGLADETGRSSWRALGARAVHEARSGPRGPGPVHLNLALREPLVDVPDELPTGRAGGAPWVALTGGGSAGPVPDDVAATVSGWVGRRGVVVAGAGCGEPAAVLALARWLGWPVLADPRSGCRVDDSVVVSAADAIVRNDDQGTDDLGRGLRPDVVLQLGGPWASKGLAAWVAGAARAGAEVAAVDPWWRWVDPDHVRARTWAVDPDAWLAAATGAVDAAAAPPAGWTARWQSLERAAQGALCDELDGPDGRWCEPAVARQVWRAAGTGTRLVVASSMPVRDLEWYAPVVAGPPTVLANRGANGIDGVTSTALGVAASGEGPVLALLGDLAFLHDVSGLVQLVGATQGSPCVLVVVDNGGGGIFSFLPQRRAEASADAFERLFATPPVTSVADVARGFGLPVASVADAHALGDAIADALERSGCSVVHVEVPGRDANVAAHDRLHEAVARALHAVVTGED